MKDEKKLIGQVDASQITKWKKEKELDKVLTIVGTSPGTEERHIGYFKTPSRKIIGAAMVSAKDKKGVLDTIKFLDQVKKNIWLGGSDLWLTNDAMTAKFDEKINDLMPEVDAELGEL